MVMRPIFASPTKIIRWTPGVDCMELFRLSCSSWGQKFFSCWCLPISSSTSILSSPETICFPILFPFSCYLFQPCFPQRFLEIGHGEVAVPASLISPALFTPGVSAVCSSPQANALLLYFIFLNFSSAFDHIKNFFNTPLS